MLHARRDQTSSLVQKSVSAGRGYPTGWFTRSAKFSGRRTSERTGSHPACFPYLHHQLCGHVRAGHLEV